MNGIKQKGCIEIMNNQLARSPQSSINQTINDQGLSEQTDLEHNFNRDSNKSRISAGQKMSQSIDDKSFSTGSNIEGNECFFEGGATLDSNEREDFERGSSDQQSSGNSNAEQINDGTQVMQNQLEQVQNEASADDAAGQNDEANNAGKEAQELAPASTPQLNHPASPSTPSMMRQELDTTGMAFGELYISSQTSPPNAPGQFPQLKLLKQPLSNVNKNNYSVLEVGNNEQKQLKEARHGTPEGEDAASSLVKERTNEAPAASQEQQMFTSMSDIGFPANIHNYNLNVDNRASRKKLLPQGQRSQGGELITMDQVRRVMDQQNNWRVRTKTIDEMLHDVRDRIAHDSEYMMVNSERFLDFFVQLLTDQNFKIVLNTLNVLNMIVGMPQQRQRYEKLMRQELKPGQSWGLSNATLSRHLPQIVKKLADSKNIIRQEAVRCLFQMNEIMRSGNQKENNLIALVLPYLNNSSNWHIREELLNLLIRCFLTARDQSEFDCFQILDSILQLLVHDTKEKVRSLALEAVSAFASIGPPNKLSEVMFQLNCDKEVCELVGQRLDQGLWPTLNAETGNIELPYQELFNQQSYDVDSVAHSMTNQTQGPLSQGNANGGGAAVYHDQRRKQSIGGSSHHGIQPVLNQSLGKRGKSSGRKIVVATANTTNQQQLGLSQHDELLQQALQQNGKRTASANNPNYEFEGHHPLSSLMNGNNKNLLMSENGSTPHGGVHDAAYTQGMASREQPIRHGQHSQYEESTNAQDCPSSSFLPKLQKVVSHQDGTGDGVLGGPQMPFNHRKRMVGSSDNVSHDGFMFGSGHPSMDPSKQFANAFVGNSGAKHVIEHQSSHPISKAAKRSNKYLHGTPAQPTHNFYRLFSQFDQDKQFQRGNSGNVLLGHHSGKDPSGSMWAAAEADTLSGYSREVPVGLAVPQYVQEENGGKVATVMTTDSNNPPQLGGHQGTHFKQISSLKGPSFALNNQSHGPPGNFSQNTSDIGGLMDNNDVLSLIGKQSQSNYEFQQQTPSQYTQHHYLENSHLLLSAGVNKPSAMSGIMGGLEVGARRDAQGNLVGASAGHSDLAYQKPTANFNNAHGTLPNNNSFNLGGQVGHRGGFNPNQLMMVGAAAAPSMHQNQGAHPQSLAPHFEVPSNKYRHPGAQRNIQATFYSDGTNVTGTTAATGGAQSQNRGASHHKSFVPARASGHFGRPQEEKQAEDASHGTATNFQAQMSNARQGPVKATRAALGNQAAALNIQSTLSKSGQQSELVIDSRREKHGKGSAAGAGGYPGTHSKSLKIQQKGLALTNRMKSLNSNDLAQQAKTQESGRSQARNYGQLDADGGNSLTAGTSYQRAVSHDQESKLLELYVSQANESKKGMSGGFGDEEKMAIGMEAGVEEQDATDPAMLTQSSKINYVPFEELEPLEKPEKEFKKCISKGQGIHSQDWTMQFEACNIIRRVCKHHQSLILGTVNQLQSLVGTLIKLADSLRSAVCRISLITLNEMFISLKRVMEPCLDPVMKILLKKGADTNHFIAQCADKCLLSLVQNCQEQKVLQILQLQNMASKSSVYRLKICQCLQNIVRSLGNNILFFKENDKLLSHLANYLFDASQDVRQAAKMAFVCMSQAIMGQNELEKLLQRVLKENQYKKVKEYLDKEPTHLMANQGSQIDFVITNAASTTSQQPHGKRMATNKIQQQSFKNLRLSNLAAKAQEGKDLQDCEPLNIQAKSILHPNAQHVTEQQSADTQGFLSKLTHQTKQQTASTSSGGQPQASSTSASRNMSHGRNAGPSSDIATIQHDQFFIDAVKDLILKTQINDWRSRQEAADQLFDLIRANIKKFEGKGSFEMLELADALCKLINDSNAKIQLSALDNLNNLLDRVLPFIMNHFQLFYKSLLANLGSTNLGVRKSSEAVLRHLNSNTKDKHVLLQMAVSVVQSSNNVRMRAGVIDQVVEILEIVGQDIGSNNKQDQVKNSVNNVITKSVMPLAFRIIDDTKMEVKQRSEKLLRKIFTIIGTQVLEVCPKSKLQKVTDICLGGQSAKAAAPSLASQSNQVNAGSKKEFSTGTFGANGNQLLLNSRT